MRDGIVRLSQVAELNPESLGVSTPADLEFTYVDLATVHRGTIRWGETERFTYRSAPSRARRAVKAGDAIFGTVRPLNQSHASFDTLDDLIVVSTGFSVIRPDHTKLDARFLRQLLFSEGIVHQSVSQAVGSNYPAVNERDVAAFRFWLPHLAEQHKIAEILDAVDERLASLRRVLLKQQTIRHAVLNEIAARTAKLGSIVRLGDIAESITSGSRGWAQYYMKDGAPFLRIANLTRSHINLQLDDVVRVLPPAGSEGERTRVRPKDILVSITADLGIIGVISDRFGPAYVNQHIALIRPTTGVNSRWVGHYLSSDIGQSQFIALNDSGAKAGLNLRAVSSLRVVVLDPAEQDRLVCLVDSCDQQNTKTRAAAAKLGALKQGLMEDLLTGRVRVSVGGGV